MFSGDIKLYSHIFLDFEMAQWKTKSILCYEYHGCRWLGGARRISSHGIDQITPYVSVVNTWRINSCTQWTHRDNMAVVLHFQMHFLNENAQMLIKISLKFFSRCVCVCVCGGGGGGGGALFSDMFSRIRLMSYIILLLFNYATV